MGYLLGIDVGTTGCKASILSLDGAVTATAYRRNTFLHPQPGWFEQSPLEWWENVREIIREALRTGGVDSRAIRGVGISCTNGTFPVDAKGVPLANAIMQMDNRATQEVADIKARHAEAIFRITGNRVAEGLFSLPSLLWMRRNQPEAYDRADKFLLPSSFIIQRLTGKAVIDPSRASTILFMDMTEQRWSSELCEMFGMSEERLPDLLPTCAVAGTVHRDAALLTGLACGTPVLSGAMDTLAAAVGVGVRDENDAFMVLGTMGRTGVCVPRDKLDGRFHSCPYVYGNYLMIASNSGCGISVRWFKETFAEAETAVYNACGLSPYALLDTGAARVPPGSDGLLYLPYIGGERSPIWDSNARGVFFGISPRHTKAHFMRAIMEGVSFAMKHNISIMENELGIRIDRIRISGGGSHSDIWMQIMADVLGKTMERSQSPESETMGIAAVAARTLGLDDAPFIGSRGLGPDVFFPDGGSQTAYEPFFAVYTGLYPALRHSFGELAHAVSRQ
jgi:xylulokinase